MSLLYASKFSSRIYLYDFVSSKEVFVRTVNLYLVIMVYYLSIRYLQFIYYLTGKSLYYFNLPVIIVYFYSCVVKDPLVVKYFNWGFQYARGSDQYSLINPETSSIRDVSCCQSLRLGHYPHGSLTIWSFNDATNSLKATYIRRINILWLYPMLISFQ